MTKNTSASVLETVSFDADSYRDTIAVDGENLTIDQVVRVARHGAKIRLSDEDHVVRRVQASCAYIQQAVESGQPIYGVTTSFGSMSDVVIPVEMATDMQNNLPFAHKTGAGRKLPKADVRAGLLLRANSLLRGISGVRLEIIARIEKFLNAGVTPHVHELGSIGASGDLVPMAYFAGALAGLDASFKVDFQGEEVDSITALGRLGLPPLRLAPKEGLAIMNGTAVMTGIAANCVHDVQTLLSLAAHALYAQGLGATNQSFHPFIHQHKKHPGQVWTASHMLGLLEDSRLIYDELDGSHGHREKGPIQDRYSLRCIPQYTGPIVDGVSSIAGQIETEINSTTDNPLIDAENQVSYHCGNFLGQYVGVSMDQLRYYVGLLAKHLDVQIALLTAPEFNNGLPASLVGNTGRKINTGLKALQLTGNSIMPLLAFFGNSLADRFPTHAEQFNQNINSQGFGSANLARQSVELFQQYMAVALMFGVQAVDLRTHATTGQYDARACLSPATSRLYEAVRAVIGRPPSAERPYVWDDHEQALDTHIARIAADIAADGRIPQAVNDTIRSMKAHSPFIARIEDNGRTTVSLVQTKSDIQNKASKTFVHVSPPQ